MKIKAIDPIACMYLTKRHRPEYYGNPKVRKNTGLPAGRTYTVKEYYDEKRRIDIKA